MLGLAGLQSLLGAGQARGDFDTGEQFAAAYRFDDVVVCACFEAADAVVFRGPQRREHDHEGVDAGGVIFDPSADFAAVHIGQHTI